MKVARKIFKVVAIVLGSLFVLGAILMAGYADGGNVGWEEFELFGILIEAILASATVFCYFIYNMLK